MGITISLSPREAQVAKLAAEGKTSWQIAQKLGTSTRTIETQLQACYREVRKAFRIGGNSRALLVRAIFLGRVQIRERDRKKAARLAVRRDPEAKQIMQERGCSRQRAYQIIQKRERIQLDEQSD